MVVVGCGVIGLTTALRLRSAGFDVEVWARDDLSATTSAAAGAIWYPFLAEPREAVARWSAVTFTRLRALAERGGAGVRMCSVMEGFADEAPDLWWASAVPDVEFVPAAEIPTGYRSAVRTKVPVCDVPVYLDWLIGELARAEINVVRREIADFEEAFAAAEVVVNCAGLGARELCQDQDLRPVRGQLIFLDGVEIDTAWIDDTTPRPRYVVPRAGRLVLGGTAQERDERTEPDDEDTESILADAVKVWPELSEGRVGAVSVGLRPYRSAVRLERELRPDGRLLLHNYGHGGSGYTVSWGCADDVVELASG